MVVLLTGLPGSGKTYRLVWMIIQELVFTDRFVITSCQDLKLDRLNAYLQERYPDRVIDLDKRLLVLEKEEVFAFFRYRAGGLVLAEPPEKVGDRKIRPEEFVEAMKDYFKPVAEKPETMTPVSYFITEAHDYFNAEEWQQRGRSVQYYVSKHRHLHDELVLETQFPGQLDNKMRSLVEQHVDLVNNYKRVLGPFQRRGCFSAQVFYKVAKPSSVPDYKFEFHLEPQGVGSCYHTTGALGIVNRGAEATGFRKKRLPWWSMWAAAAGVAAAIGVACFLIPKALSAGLSSMVSATGEGFNKALGTQVKAPAARSVRGSGAEGAPVSAERVAIDNPENRGPIRGAGPSEGARAPGRKQDTPLPQQNRMPVRVIGYVASGAHATVWLSDGRVLTERDLREVNRRYVVTASGETFFLAEVRSTAESSPRSPKLDEAKTSRVESSARVASDNRSERVEGSWVVGADGVSRLREASTLR